MLTGQKVYRSVTFIFQTKVILEYVFNRIITNLMFEYEIIRLGNQIKIFQSRW